MICYVMKWCQVTVEFQCCFYPLTYLDLCCWNHDDIFKNYFFTLKDVKILDKSSIELPSVPDSHLRCSARPGRAGSWWRGWGRPCCRWSRLQRTAVAAAAVAPWPPTGPAGDGTAVLDIDIAVAAMNVNGYLGKYWFVNWQIEANSPCGLTRCACWEWRRCRSERCTPCICTASPSCERSSRVSACATSGRTWWWGWITVR